MVMGLARLEDPELIAQLGRLVTDGGFLAGLLNECPLAKRREAYEAIRPHLRFKPLPYEHYEHFFRIRADAIASSYSPVIVGDCILRFTCYKCQKRKKYRGRTPADAAVKARKAGWVRDLTLNKEFCPKCPPPKPN